MENEILEIQTSVVRQIIRIDLVDYELLNIDEFGFKDYVWLMEENKKINNIKSEDMTSADADELSSALDMVMEKSLLAPKEVRNKLTDIQKMKIMRFFLRNLPKKKNEETTASSLDSKDTMEEIPVNG
jgi:uncharacterized protein YfkK (UPF0435 family)